MIQMKLIGPMDSFFDDPLFKAIFCWKGWFLIGQYHLMPPPPQFFAKIEYRLGRSCPFPIANEMKDLQSIPPFPLACLWVRQDR